MALEGGMMGNKKNELFVEKTWNKVKEGLRKGMSHTEISREYGMNITVVRRYAKAIHGDEVGQKSKEIKELEQDNRLLTLKVQNAILRQRLKKLEAEQKGVEL